MKSRLSTGLHIRKAWLLCRRCGAKVRYGPTKAATPSTSPPVPGEVEEAQRLRFKVFAEEMGANLPNR